MATERAPEGRAAWVLSQLYYYAAAVIGIGFLMAGAVSALFGLRSLGVPAPFDSVRDAVREILGGLAFLLPGAVLLWTHLREARRREGGPLTGVFWGASLYFHAVSLVALAFLLVGTIGILHSLVDLVLPACHEGGCYPSPAEAGRQIVDFAIFLVVGGPVFWWHLRQGRRLTSPVQPGPE